MTPLHQEAVALAASIAQAETGYDQRATIARQLRGRGRLNKADAARLYRLDDDMEAEADALRALRTRLEQVQRRADTEARRVNIQAERDRQGVLL